MAACGGLAELSGRPRVNVVLGREELKSLSQGLLEAYNHDCILAFKFYLLQPGRTVFFLHKTVSASELLTSPKLAKAQRDATIGPITVLKPF